MTVYCSKNLNHMRSVDDLVRYDDCNVAGFSYREDEVKKHPSSMADLTTDVKLEELGVAEYEGGKRFVGS